MIKPRRYRVAVSREGWVYLFVLMLILMAGLIRDINLLVLLFGMLLGPLFFSWLAVIVSLRKVEVERQLPQEIVAGEPFNVAVFLGNSKRHRTSWGVAVDDRIERVDQAAGAVTGGVLFFRTEPGQRARGAYQVTLDQRGEYRFGPIVASTRFPLGLIRRSMTFDDFATIRVMPRLGRLNPSWAQLISPTTHFGRNSDRRLGLREGEFLGLREWRPGDSSRWIHWRTTARKGELMVRQFERHQNHDLAILLDLWQPDVPGDQDLKRVELAVSMAATLLHDTCRQGGGQIWLASAGRDLAVIRGAASMAMLRDGLEGLALVQGAPHQRLLEILRLANSEVPRATRGVMISTRELSAELTATRLDSRGGSDFLQRLETIDVGSPTLERCFQPL